MGFDISTDTSNSNIVMISAPPALLPKSISPGGRAYTFKLFFDTAAGTIAGTESVEVEADGTHVTREQTFIYEDRDGVPVPVGNVLEVKNDEPYTIDVSDSMLTEITDPESIPEIDPAEAAALGQSADALRITDPIIGDPSDPDYTESYITVYEEVVTNSLEDSYFRIAMER